jgi:hypothetical protein
MKEKKKLVSNPSRETVGKIASDLLKKADDHQLNPQEIQAEVHKGYIDNLLECYNTHKTIFPGDFYIVIITKKERLMENVLRNYFFARSSCPTTDYDQAVYRYNKKDNEIEFLWVIPSKDTCEYLKANALDVAPEERELLRYVLEFYDGTLIELVKKLNGEQKDSLLLAK